MSSPWNHNILTVPLNISILQAFYSHLTMDDIKPILTRQNVFYDELTSDRYKKSKTKYRWIWMMRNEDHLLWRVCTRSQNWFYTYPECKQNAYQYEPIIPPCTYARLYIEIFNNGFKNVVEISSKNDPEEEAYL